jgi:hypothetical protein
MGYWGRTYALVENMIKRHGVISWGGLLGQPEFLKQHLLIYDELWVPWLERSYPTKKDIEEWDLDEEHLASISWLMDKGVVLEPPVDLDTTEQDEVVAGLLQIFRSASRVGEKSYPTAEQAALEGAAASFNIDIALSRLTTYLLWRDRKEVAYPVVFPFEAFDTLPNAFKEIHDVLSVVVKRFPAPAPDVPLEDLLAFKRDPETQYKFSNFWQWVRKMAEGKGDIVHIDEELDSLITEYSQQLSQLSKEKGHERLELLLTLPGDIIEDALKIRWGNIGRRLVQLRKAAIAAHAAEMKVPGNEIAYVTEASRLLSGRHKATLK